MKLFISRIYARLLVLWYINHSPFVRFKYINKKGYWEFEICKRWHFYYEEILFQTKGLR